MCRWCSFSVSYTHLDVYKRQADPRSASLIFPHSFPQGEEEIGAVLMLEQQIDLVDIDPGVALQPTVADDAVEDAVQHHQHSYRQKLLAKVPDIVAEDTGVGVHIGGLGKGVETAVCKQLNGQRHILRFLFRLAEQLGVEVLQGGDRAVIALSLIHIYFTTAEQLAGLAQLVNDKTASVSFEGKTIYLDNDLDLSGSQWTPIGDGSNHERFFAGTFDGQHHKIMNLYHHYTCLLYTSRCV